MKTNFPRMFEYMIFSNVSLFTSLFAGLKVSDKNAKETFCPVSSQSEEKTIIP